MSDLFLYEITFYNPKYMRDKQGFKVVAPDAEAAIKGARGLLTVNALDYQVRWIKDITHVDAVFN